MISQRRLRHCLLAIVALTALLNGCASNNGTVVLLPEKDRRDTAVAVKDRDREVVLSEPYAAVRQAIFGPLPYTSSPQEVEALFGAALAAQPDRPAQFMVYFVEGSEEFTVESQQIIESVFAAIARRSVPDVLVVGHADKVASDQVNDALSRRRADAVRAGLIGKGVAPEDIMAVGRGKREPIVPTEEGVSEPRNRRVEVFVR